MKHIVTLVALLLCSCATAFAQDSTATDTWVGQPIYSVKMHMGVGRYSKDFAHARFSMDIMGSVDLPLTKHFGVQGSWQVTQFSTRIKGYYGNEQITEANFRNTLDYIRIPLQACYYIDYFSENNEHGWLAGPLTMVKFGPYVGYGLRGKASVKPENTDTRTTFDENLFRAPCSYNGIATLKDGTPLASAKYRRWDVGLAAGFELRINHVAYSVDFAFGLTPICKDFAGEKIRTRTVMFGLGYIL